MTSTLRRVGSFKRSKDRKADAEDRKSHGVVEERKSHPVLDERRSNGLSENSFGERSGGGLVHKILRSASFERRSRQSKGAGAHAPTGAPTASDGSSSQSSPAEYEDPNPDGPLGNLHGWLKKRHCKDHSMTHQWAKRYFNVDDTRGTISYAKSETKKPSVILPLVDITAVKEVHDTHEQHAFIISCPPVHLTVCAEDREDRILWIRGLRRRMALWREKQAQTGYAIASLSIEEPLAARTLLPRDSYVPPRVANADHQQQPQQYIRTAPVACNGEQLGHPEPTLKAQHRDPPSQTREFVAVRREWSPRDMPPEDSIPPAPHVQPQAETHHLSRRTVQRPTPTPDTEVSMVETVEIVSEDDDDEPLHPVRRPVTSDSPPRGSVRQNAIHRDLTDMLSSDEDEDDLPPSKPAPRRGTAVDPGSRVNAVAGSRDDLSGGAQVMPMQVPDTLAAPSGRLDASAAPDELPPGSAPAVMPWLDDLPGAGSGGHLGAHPAASAPLEEGVEPNAPASTGAAPPHHLFAGEAAAPTKTAADEDWDASDDEPPDYQHSAPLPASVGSTVVPDKNFVDEDWDDDDDDD